MKYALCGALLAAIVAGAYYSGYSVGSRDARIEYVEKEVIKYVEIENKRADIYSSANITRDNALQLLHDGKL